MFAFRIFCVRTLFGSLAPVSDPVELALEVVFRQATATSKARTVSSHRLCFSGGCIAARGKQGTFMSAACNGSRRSRRRPSRWLGNVFAGTEWMLMDALYVFEKLEKTAMWWAKGWMQMLCQVGKAGGAVQMNHGN